MAKRFGHLIDWPTEIVNATVDSNTTDYIEDINRIVAGSPIRNYDWNNRGRAPIGYIKGIALMYARSYLELKTGQDSAVKVMCQPLGGSHKVSTPIRISSV
jgi:hypothetical protein